MFFKCYDKICLSFPHVWIIFGGGSKESVKPCKVSMMLEGLMIPLMAASLNKP